MSADDHLLELLPAYALGSLDPAEHGAVSEHVQNCPVCAAELATYQTVAAGLALAAPDALPPTELKRRLLARVQKLPSAPVNRPPINRRLWLPNFSQRAVAVWGIASFLLILVLIASNLLLWQRLTRLETTARSGGMRAIPLTGLTPGAAGFILIGADGQNGAFVVDALPTLEPNYQYQLWLLQNGEYRTSGAVFSVDEYGYGGGRIRAPKNLFEYSGCDVSVEPAGGSSEPTGEKVLAGTLN